MLKKEGAKSTIQTMVEDSSIEGSPHLKTLFNKLKAADISKKYIRGALKVALGADDDVLDEFLKDKIEDCKGDKRLYVPQDHSIELDILMRLEALGVELRLNSRSGFKEISRDSGKTWNKMSDGQASMLLSDLQKEVCTFPTFNLGKQSWGGLKHKKVSRDDFNLYTDSIAARNPVDTFKVWLEKLPKWDKVGRLSFVLEKLFYVDGNANKILSNWAFKSVLLAAVHRTFNPGYKHDEMVILHGEEGIGKSTLWAKILPQAEYFSDNLDMSASYKERLEGILGCVLVENAELSGLRRSDLNTLKAFITRQHDTVRLSYRRNAETFPRQFILVGTTNDARSLPNDMGNRRFLPLTLKQDIDRTKSQSVDLIHKYMDKYREQLWAEALYLYKQGIVPRTPDDLLQYATEARDCHRSRDEVLESSIIYWLEKNDDSQFNLKDLVRGLVPKVEASIYNQKQVAKVLRGLGYDSARKMQDDKKITVWGKWGV